MRVEQQQVGTVHVLTPIGALVDDDAQEFTAALLERLASARVVVAMREVPYLDSTAIEGLLSGADELRNRAASLKLAGVSPTCREILELTGCAERFSFFNNVQDAVKSYL